MCGFIVCMCAQPMFVVCPRVRRLTTVAGRDVSSSHMHVACGRILIKGAVFVVNTPSLLIAKVSAHGCLTHRARRRASRMSSSSPIHMPYIAHAGHTKDSPMEQS